MADLKMPDINNILIAGNLTSDPIFRKTSNGTSVVNFYIASNRKYRDNSGIWRESVCYVGVVAWHKVAEACHETLKKGSTVLIDGELQSRSWKNEDGTSRNVVEIRARRIQFLDRKTNREVEEISPSMAVDAASSSSTTESSLQPEPPTAPNEDEEVKVEPTDFDFGYQDLKL